MRNRESQIIIPIITVILAMVLAVAMPTPVFKILFIIGVGGENFLFFKNRDADNKKWKIPLYVLGVVIGSMWVWSVINTGSLDAYVIKLSSFFKPEEDAESFVQLAYTDVNNQYSADIEELANINEQFEIVMEDIEKLTNYLDEAEFFSSKKDPQEIEAIVAYISEEYNKNSSDFSKLKINRQGAELFYKMRLSRQKFHYCNIISALEAFGVDCEAMGIDEYTLMLWDVQDLFVYYSMKQSILADAAQKIKYEENLKLYYRDFKIKNLNEYSDTFNYGGWHWDLESADAEVINQRINGRIMDYYEKFCMNFKAGAN